MHKPPFFFPSACVFACLLLVTAAATAHASGTYQWVQYVPGGLEARAVTSAKSCPIALVDGTEQVMQVRAGPGENYPVLACSLPVTPNTHQLSIEGVALKLPVAVPQRILLLGDTGCRLKGEQVQACNEAVAWPFRNGAAEAALLAPDLVIHVGDFHYRETPCPQDKAGCSGSPFGDNWQVWEEDFFAPVGSLLSTAPWVLVRGNHEECQRGGRGWARMLDAYAWDADAGCLPSRDPWLVDLGGVSLAVMDVSTAGEDDADTDQASRFSAQYASLGELGSRVWISQHRPIWAVDNTVPVLAGDNKTLALAARNSLPANVQMILSGHHHAVEVLAYEDDLPLQLVTGNGGDELSMGVPKDSTGLAINGVGVRSGHGVTGVFGYSLLDRDPADALHWLFTSYDYDGMLLLACDLRGRDADCH